jgi:signal transduction histidine kinase/ligand-binding sensor domain-containing protein
LARLLSIVFFFLVCSSSRAQLVKRFSFTHYGLSTGLASNEVTNAFQDETGYMWIGTNNGLQRFDGTRYKTFRVQKGDSTSIPNNVIIQLLFDKKNNLWLITADQKVGIFDTRNFTYHEMKVKVRDPAIENHGKRLICDNEGNLLLLFVDASFLTWNETKQEFSADYNFISVPDDLRIVDVIQQPGTKKYWIGTYSGTAIYDRQTKNINYTGHNPDKNQFIEKFGSIPLARGFLIDSKNRLWFFSWSSGMPLLYAYDLKKNEFELERYNLGESIKSYFEVGGFLEQKNGTVWVRGLGVFGRYLEKEKEFQLVYNGYENEQSISYARVDNFFEDREENIWVSTNTNGLYQFNPSSQFFTNVRQINRFNGRPGDGSVMSFIQTRQGILFVGTWNDGFYEFDRNYNMIPTNIRGLIGNPFAWCLSLSPDSNTIWMGAQPGIFKINQSALTAVYHNPSIMQNRTVRQIVEDKYGNLWMGTQGLGLFKWSAAKGKKNFDDGVSQFKGVPTTVVTKITIDKKGYVWVATSSAAVYVIDPSIDKVMMHFGTEEPPERKLSWNGSAGALQYDDTTVMIAANGIYVYNTRQERISSFIKIPETLPGMIAAMEKDRNGYLWVSTTNGILRLNPRNKIFVQFDRTDGIVNDYFILAASYVLPDGKIMFGADNQFVVFDPEQVRINKPAPDVTITGFKLTNKSLLIDSLLKSNRIELGPGDNAITIEFSGLSYSGTYNIDYQLEGLDKTWMRSDKTNQAVYSYLPPGRYTFLAKSEDAEGHPSKDITRLVINVRPPFWKTWWFLGLTVFAVVGLLFWLDKLRMQKLRATESIRTRIATSLTEDMSNSLSSINISSELAKTKVDTDKERTKEYIAQISDISNRMVQAMYDMVWSIDPKNDTMLDTIDRMKSFAVETESLNNIDILFDIEEAAADLKLDMAHRYELLSVFKEAISNIVKHSDARNVQVSLRLKNSKFYMLVEDDGKGFDPGKASMGRGINDMKRRAEAIKASLHIESEKNTGTVLKLEMPV